MAADGWMKLVPGGKYKLSLTTLPAGYHTLGSTNALCVLVWYYPPFLLGPPESHRHHSLHGFTAGLLGTGTFEEDDAWCSSCPAH